MPNITKLICRHIYFLALFSWRFSQPTFNALPSQWKDWCLLSECRVTMVSVWFQKFLLYYTTTSSYLSKCPLTWNRETFSFQFDLKSFFQYKHFYFWHYFINGCLNQGALFSAAVLFFKNPQMQNYISFEIAIVYLLFCGVLYFPLWVAAILPTFCKTEVYAMNSRLKLDYQLERICRNCELYQI